MTSTDTRHTFAPLFDDSDLASLGRWNTRQRVNIEDAARGNFEARVLHASLQDPSEQFDPIEATVDANLEHCRLTVTERLCVATAFAAGIGMALAAWVA